MKFTIQPDKLTRDNIEQNCPFIVQEIDEEASPYTYKNAEALGLLFDTMQEAMIAAKRLYWQSIVRRHSRPWQKGEPNAEIYYDSMSQRMYVRTYGLDEECRLPYVTTSYMFPGREEAEKALADIGEYNFAKYVLGLSGVELLTRQRL